MSKSEKKNRREIIILIVALLLYAVVYGTGYVAGRREESDARSADGVYSDGYDDGLGDGYSVGYEDGYSDAYAYGYADGHEEAQGHSETYDELLRQAYRTTGGKGATFKTDAAGNVFVEETAPNGQKVWVPFTP